MIDLRQLRDEPKKTIDLIKKKDPSFDARLLYDLDIQVRDLRQEVETLRNKKNELAKAARSGITQELKEQSKQIGVQLKTQEVALKAIEEKFHALYLACPNLPMPDVPAGDKEENKVIKEVGTQPAFSFEIKHHVDLVEALDWIDFKTAAKLAGSNFALYKGDAVKLIYSLAMFMLKNNISHGYTPILPPVLVNEKSLEVSGNFPKFKEDVYSVPKDKLYLTPTSEVNLANMYRDHIFEEKDLPVRMTSWTSCFRREAGTYGAHERGLIRIHQFEKVELYALSEPEKSYQELDRMIASAESILQKLGLHYRVSLLAAQDCSFPSAKTYDIEVWMPGQKAYYEVSSCSNCTDFQARRGSIRYKGKSDSKAKLVHTLNGSSLALPRLMVALMETYQQEDGSIALPDILKKTTLF
ncbi:serine--tRNA ligase [bacterium]|nr:serine--tRNA ligase [bacterium]